MPEQFLHLSVEERKDILLAGAAETGRSELILEKDVWVCWALQALFTMPGALPMAFKGGTSLSKVYNVIDRFSEDVDVTIDYKSLSDGFDPFKESVSKTAIKKFSARLKDQVLKHANDVIAPYLKSQINYLPQPETYDIKVSDDGEKIWVKYPSISPNDNKGYMQNSILIELGGRNMITPNESHLVSPEIAELVTNLEYPQAEVTVLSAERTFWEKMTLIHVECNRKEIKANPHRMSRHWYDLSMLAKHDIGQSAMNNTALLEDVVRLKSLFFNSSYANYEACLNKKISLIPVDNVLKELQVDYESMIKEGMVYGEAPSFSEIIENITRVESAVNE